MKTARDIAEDIIHMTPGTERTRAADGTLEIIKLWLYWEKHVDPPREKLLRQLREAEQLLERI